MTPEAGGESGTTLAVVPIGPGSSLVLAELREHALLSYAVGASLALTPDVVVVTDTEVAGLGAALRDHPAVAVRRLDDAASAAQLSHESADRRQIVVHDPRCPLLPVAELRRVASSSALAAIGVRPVTDTVKIVLDRSVVDLVSATVDRDDYRAICSPLVLSPTSVAILTREIGPVWWTVDLWLLVAALRPHVTVDLVDVSSLGRRVEDENAIWLLECFDDVRRMVRET